MPEAQANKINPLVAIAAVSIIIFSAVGVGVMTGVIPSSKSDQSAVPVTAAPTPAPQAAATPAAAPAPASSPATETAPAETPKKVVKKAAPKHESTHVASAEPRYAQNESSAPPPPPAPRVCGNCGSVVAVNTVKHQGEGSGLGAVGGAVIGGVLGNQIGRGSGRTAATVIGAVGGGVAGNAAEKHYKSNESFNVSVRMDDGSTRSFAYKEEPAFRAGDKVKVVDGALVQQ
jgi:outer membrane lipoprotein SlyB